MTQWSIKQMLKKLGQRRELTPFPASCVVSNPQRCFLKAKGRVNAWNKATLVLLAGRQAQTLLPDSLAEAGASASHGSRTLWGPEEEGTFPQMTLPTQSCEILYPFVRMYWNQIQLLTAEKTYTQEMSVGGKGKVASFRRPATWEDGGYVLRPSPRYLLGDQGYFSSSLWLHWVFTVVWRLSCPEGYGIFVPWPGMECTSPALEGGFLTTGPPGESPGDGGFKGNMREGLLCVWSACAQFSHWLASK